MQPGTAENRRLRGNGHGKTGTDYNARKSRPLHIQPAVQWQL